MGRALDIRLELKLSDAMTTARFLDRLQRELDRQSARDALGRGRRGV